MATRRALTGIRTTGRLHLGHYIGALKQWIQVQDTGNIECFFLLADVQALTTHADRPEVLANSIRDVVLDWLAVGLNPNRTNVHFVLQSQVPERAALSQLLQMIAYKNEVERNPTLKAELEQQHRGRHSTTMGFMTYPIDQVADILMVCPYPPEPGDELLVPVGEDQVPHLEYARVLARRFNEKYNRRVFIPCEPIVGRVGRLVGIDGQAKMSKSLDNAIYLSDNPEIIRRKVMRMFTDPKRVRADIPGETENNPVFIYHRAFNSDEAEVSDLTERYQKGKVGDTEVKNKLVKALNSFLDPIRENRCQFERTNLREIVVDGTQAAREACKPVLAAATEAMFLRFPT